MIASSTQAFTAMMLASVLALVSSPVAAANKLSLDDALRLAYERSPELRVKRAEHDREDELAGAARSRLLPSIRLFDELQRYSEPFSVPFGDATFVAREETTHAFGATALQPIVGLIKHTQNLRAANSAKEASQQDIETTKTGLARTITIEWLRLFEARAAADLAGESESALREQADLARTREKAGALTEADVLRVSVAAANARQQGILFKAQEGTLRAQILGTLGLSPFDPNVELMSPDDLLDETLRNAKEPLVSKEAATAQALARRPELASAKLRAEAAQRQASASTLELLPEVSLEASFQHVDGQAFAPPNEGFVGLRAEWVLWEWGNHWFASEAAQAQANAQEEAVTLRAQQIQIEVVSLVLQADAARSALSLADETVESAKEAYRVTEAQVRVGAASTTDLLAAEAAKTAALLQRSNAHYENAVAIVALRYALGAKD